MEYKCTHTSWTWGWGWERSRCHSVVRGGEGGCRNLPYMLIGYFCEFLSGVFNPGFGINVFLSIMLLLLIEPEYPLAFAKRLWQINILYQFIACLLISSIVSLSFNELNVSKFDEIYLSFCLRQGVIIKLKLLSALHPFSFLSFQSSGIAGKCHYTQVNLLYMQS